MLYIVSQKNKETNHFQYKYKFYDKDHIVEFQTCSTDIPQGNLISDHEIKKHIWSVMKI